MHVILLLPITLLAYMGLGEKLRVLVVDDNKETADLLSEAMTMIGFDATVAYSGVSALHIASYYEPDVMLIDLVMPAMDGFSLAAALRQCPSTCATRLIAVTASCGDTARYRAIASGFNDFLAKPLAVHIILAAIEKQFSYLQDVRECQK